MLKNSNSLVAGELVLTVPPSAFPATGYGFISDIPGINSGYIGKTDRNGGFQYPYVGSIKTIKVYDTIIPDETLKVWTNS